MDKLQRLREMAQTSLGKYDILNTQCEDQVLPALAANPHVRVVEDCEWTRPNHFRWSASHWVSCGRHVIANDKIPEYCPDCGGVVKVEEAGDE